MALELERDRLRSRVRRMERVTAALRDRAVYRATVNDGAPAPLRHAIAGFEREIIGMHRRLSEIDRDR